MTDLQLTTALETIAGAVSLLFVVFKLVPMYRVDVFRQSMFQLREELFDYAAAGHIRFNDPAYLLLRKLMNGFIRYGHQLTVFRCLMSHLIRQLDGGTQHLIWYERWEEATGSIQDKDVRQRMLTYHNRTAWLIAKHLITGSPLLMAGLICAAGGVVASQGFTSIRQLARAGRNKVMRGVFDLRLIEEDAVYSRMNA
jgi:hypothetical protein